MDLRFDAARHVYYLDGVEVPNVTAILGPLYVGPKASPKNLERAANVGSTVHALTEDDDRHWPDVVPENPDLTYDGKVRHVGRRLAWLAWRRKVGFIPICIEKRLASRLGFAGTVDRIGRLRGGRTAVVDLKTGRMTAYARLQLSAYTIMAREAGLVEGSPERIIVQVGESGRWRAHSFPEHEQDELDWKAAHRLYTRLFSLSWEAGADRV